MDWSLLQFFKSSEFDSKDLPGSGKNMVPVVLVRLDALRALMGKRFRINSGFRTLEHNKAEGGAAHSAHLTGEAVDIGTVGWSERERIDLILYARKLGFIGVGIGRTFIHIDMKRRAGLASWIYRDGKTIAITVGTESKHV